DAGDGGGDRECAAAGAAERGARRVSVAAWRRAGQLPLALGLSGSASGGVGRAADPDDCAAAVGGPGHAPAGGPGWGAGAGGGRQRVVSASSDPGAVSGGGA